LHEAARAFGALECIVRLEWDGERLVGVPRELGVEPSCWSTVIAPIQHPGPAPPQGAKLLGRRFLEEARHAAQRAGVDESILLDATDHVVEGARSNLVVVGEDGVLRTPPLARGAVAGVAREALLDRLEEADVPHAALCAAREVIALSSVRGARAIVRIGSRAVGDGQPGPMARDLDAHLRSSSSGS